MTRWLFLLALGCGGEPTSPSDGGATVDGRGAPLGQPQQGIATYYAATGAGNCGFDPSPNDLDVAAMNDPEWQGSAVCGACAEVQGPKGAVTVRIVDRCPECAKGHLDLSREAFAKIAEVAQGRVNITWKLTPCAVSGPLEYRFKEGSSQWWTAIQVRNHRAPIRALAWSRDGQWIDVKRESYNYFVEPKGMGAGAVKLRVTSWDGQTLEDTLPRVLDAQSVKGSAQFR